jgi:hypothetical protein
VTAAAVLGALLVASPHGWTLTHFAGPAHGLLTDTEVQVYMYILSGLKTLLETGEPLEA